MTIRRVARCQPHVLSSRADFPRGICSWSASRYGRIFNAVWSGAAATIALLGADFGFSAPGGALPGDRTLRRLGDHHLHRGLDQPARSRHRQHIDQPYLARFCARRQNLRRALFHQRSGCSRLQSPPSPGRHLPLVFPHIDWIALFNVSANVRASEVRFTVAAAAVLMLLGLPCNLAGKLLAGYQELHRNNLAVCARRCRRALPGWRSASGCGSPCRCLFVMSAGCLTFASLCNAAGDCDVGQAVAAAPASARRSRAIKELLNSGSSFFLIQVAAVVVFSSDNLVVSHYLGAAEVTPYSVTWRLVGLAILLQSLIFPALWPAYAEAYARRDYDWIRRTFSLTMKGTVALNLACVIVLVLFGTHSDSVWAGPAAVPTSYLLLAMGVWAIISGFMSVESCLLAALNRTREQAVLVDCRRDREHRAIDRPGAAHRLAGRHRWNDSVLSISCSWCRRV